MNSSLLQMCTCSKRRERWKYWVSWSLTSSYGLIRWIQPTRRELISLLLINKVVGGAVSFQQAWRHIRLAVWNRRV